MSGRDFNQLSGQWAGWSIQFNQRITETLQLAIKNGRFSGTGKDKDGEFEIQGVYIERKQDVLITRTYTWTTEPSQSGVGIPYEYIGKWDGSFVSGLWHPRWDPDSDGGPFEMWPGSESMSLDLQFEVEREIELVGSR